MKIGAFEVKEPVPKLKEPYALAILRPWIDVNNVGTLLLKGLEQHFGAKELGRLARPGRFFDFTRYRPTLYFEEHIRKVRIPNTILNYAKREKGNDLLFLHLLEPHSQSDLYVDSVLRILKRFEVKKYILLGSMYDAVPHTRPLIVNGGAVGRETSLDLRKSGAQSSLYQGPTTITILITQKAPEFGVETIWLIVSLPQYIQLEEDYLGKVRLMEILNLLYDIPIDKKDLDRAGDQLKLLNQKVEKTPEMRELLPQLEAMYEVRIKRKEWGEEPKLSPEMEEILWKIIGKDFGEA
jgi:hypothetical protein